MRLALTLLLPVLLMVSCDKPASSGVQGDDQSAVTIPRLKHAQREGQAPDKSEELLMILEEALKIDATAAREKAIADVAWNAIETAPEVAHEAFQKLPAGSIEKIRLIQHYAMRLAEHNPDEALEWASTLENEQEIAAAKTQIALTIAETDPRRAANMISESGIAGREFDVALVQVVQRWAAQSPPDAAAWVVLFPPGAAREAGIRILAEQWLPRDPPSAFGWLSAMKNEALRKETARAMEGVILQQTEDIRKDWLQHADPKIQSELERQLEQAIKDVGDNIPSPVK